MTAVLGIDIGGTKIAGLLVNSHNQTLAETVVATPTANPEQLVDTLYALIDALLTRANLTKNALAALGVGIPGQVDVASGTVATAVNLNLDHYPIGKTLANQLNVPIVVENDVRAAAVGAYHHLFSAEPNHSLAYLNLGTGVSAGVMLNGRLYRGRKGMAGEIGHIAVEPNGVVCNCGQRGCLETIIAGPALLAQAIAVLGETAVGSPTDLYHAAAAGHPAAQALVERITQTVAMAIQWLILTYDVDKIVLGGGVLRIGAPLLDPVLATLNHMRSRSPLLQTLLSSDMVQVLPATFNAGLWGIIHLAQEANRPLYSQSSTHKKEI